MHLNVWHAAASSEDSADKLDSSRFILVSVSEMSDVVPVAMPHPIFLDVGSKEVIEKTGKSLAPLWFWVFRIHTVWSWLPGGEPVHQIAFPHLSGTMTIDTYQRRLEAKRADQDPKRESAGAETSPKETPVPEKAPHAVASGNKAASSTEITHQGERDLETALGIVECIHALRLQIIHEMGGMREVEQAAVRTLMVEFARLQSILCEDLTKSLSALHSELEASSEVLSADIINILNLRPGDLAFSQVRELIQKHHKSVSMKVNLPLIELEAAKEDLKRFLQECLRELGSDPKAWEVLAEISQILSSYSRKVQETILIPGTKRPGVFK